MKETEGLIVKALEQENVNKIVIKKLKDNVIEIFTDGKKNGTGRYYSPKIKGYSQFKDYSRHPIQLSAQNIILIHHFKNDGGFGDMFEYNDMVEENEACMKDSYSIYQTAAEQFFNQLEGHYSDAFLEAMIVEATKILAENDKDRKDLKFNSGCEYESRAEKALELAKKEIK